MLKEIEGFRLSPQQKHLWQLQQIDSTPYRAYCAVLIEGNLDIKLLKATIEQVVNRHEILRTTYSYLPGMTIPLQAIADNSIENYDLSIYTAQEQADSLETLLHDFLTQQRFDLAQGPLLQLSLVKRSPCEYVLLASLPAMSADAATLRNLVQEISRSYAACVQGEKLDEEPLQYADLAAWQNELLEAADTEAGKDYWRKQDVSALAALHLPFENQPAAKLAFQPQAHTFKISVDLAARIEALAQRYNASVSEFLLACWQVLILRLTGQQNLVIGIKSDGRKYQELETAIGLFAKYLPLRSYLEPDCKFSESLQQINESINHISKWQEYFSWEELAGLPQDYSHFFPLCFEFDEQPTKYVAADVSFSMVQQYTCIDRFKVKLSCIRHHDSLVAALHYDSSLFLAEDIKRLVRQFQTLLVSAIDHPDAAISKLEILSKSERLSLLVEFNQTQIDYPKDKCIHQMFEEQAACTPDNIALVFEDQQLTYGELNRRANQLAHYLQQLGVGPGVLVALCVERSLEMAIALLGILKAGGAYVPLDPAYPKERLAFMLQNAQPSLLLTQECLTEELPEHTAPVVCFDKNWPLIAQQAQENLNLTAIAASLAYVIYTSGATGTPKGVRVTHSNLCHYVQAMRIALGIAALDVYLHTASIAFSSSVRQLMVPLTQGATITIATSEQRKDPLALFEEIKRHDVTVIDIVPSYWRNCTHALACLEPESRKALLDNKLRLIVSASEALLSDIPSNWTFGFKHRARALNMFGQTETSGIVAIYPIPAEPNERTKVIPLGRPIANTQIYLLDRHLQPVPIGVPGELYVGGLGLAEGYLNRPDLTAQKFISNPFSNEPGARLYKTGDLGRYLPDGNIEFLGRSDYQVKLRGFRIELGEIETVLCQHPAVREAVVLFREDEPGNKRLVAYIVTQNLPSDLRSFLRERLPDYMLPSTFVILEALPLTPNGKVDRKALPAPDQARLESEGTFVGPRTPVEEVIAGIWAKNLGLEQVSVRDNFFELGGHSLLATQVIYQLCEAFRMELPLRSLFEEPTVAGMAEYIERIRGTAQKLQDSTLYKANLSDRSSAHYQPLPTIVPNPDERHQPFGLTDIQQAYWIGRNGAFELSNVATHSYFEIESVDLDLERFEKAWQQLLDRHDMLRAIVKSDGQQQILEQVPPYKIKVLDLRGKNLEIAASQLAEIRDRMSHQVLPADQWPLFEIRATRLNENKVRLHISFDLLIGDAGSFQIIGRELAELIQDPEISLTPLEVSFRDYVLGEIALRNSQLYHRSLEYWQNRLPTLPPSPELPLEKNLVAVKHPRFVRRSGKLAPDTWQRLKSKANQAGVTSSGLLLATFAEILTVWSKNPRFTINLTLFNRLPLHPQVNEIVGDFTSLNLLAVDNSGQDTFEVRARRIQEQLWDDLDHRYVSGVRVLRELARIRQRASGALMPVVFTSTLTQDTASEQSSPLDWLGELVYRSGQTPQVYLDHVVSEAAGALVFNWNAVEELFPTGLLDDMFAAYCNFLERLANEDELWQATTRQLLPPAQVKQIAAINATEAPVAEGALLHTLFFDQVQRHLQKAAVVTAHRTLTYQELGDRVQQLGYQLRQLGARPNQLVAIVMEKGWEQVVATLGILASGAAYVPIDPGLPTERRWYLLEQGEVQWVLTQSQLDSCLEWPENVIRLCVDTLESPNPSAPLESVQQPEDLAYVIYTSGSTGLPKGVMINHRGAVNTILDINQRFSVKPEDRVFALSSLSFDLSVYDIFGTLAAGGTIVIPDADTAKEPAQWAQLMVQQQVTVWNSVPALMQMLVDYATARPEVLPKSLRLVMLSGDWIPSRLPDQIWASFGDVQLVSLGGATEASIWSILYAIAEVDPAWKSIPYGRAMASQRFYVLNHALEPCPLWVPGQLYIGGIGLAKGYWRNEEKTNASFIIHPQTKERLYKTGDLGRYLPDGNIEFLGREDFQVKVNGYRIELGEIETALQQHPAIKEVVVTVVGESRENKKLVAYLVQTSYQPDSIADGLRNFLQQKLPDYMVPSAYVVLNALPLTPNGKVDRLALPVPESLRPQLNVAYVMPQTETERLIAAIWQEILGIEQVGIHDNLFELGGDSLTATQLTSRIRTSFGVELPLRDVLTSPTIKSISEIVEEALLSKSSSAKNKAFWEEAARTEQSNVIPRRSQRDTVPLSFAQQRLWFLDQLQFGNPSYNLFAAVHLNGLLNIAALAQSLNEIVRRHEALRTTFTTVEGQLVQVISPTLALAFPVVNLRQLSEVERETEVLRLATEEAQRPFNLAQAPLLRATLLQLSETEHVVLIAMHHIVSDGWSMGVLIQEVAALYEAFDRGKPSPLPELPIQYADFAVWQRQWLQGEVLKAQIAYWQQQLGSRPPVLQLPTDRPRPVVQTLQGTTKSFSLPTDLTKALKALSSNEGVTLFMTLLAAFKTLLYWYTGQDDIVVGTDVANRNRAETERLIGFFVNQLVLRTDLSGNPTFRALLERVREVTLGAYAHQDLPFDKLVAALNPERHPSRTPLFQVKLILQNAPMPPLELSGLTLSRLEVDKGAAEFDLLLNVTDAEQGLIGSLEYNTDLFDAASMARMLGHFETLLRHVATQPDLRLNALEEILAEADKQQRSAKEHEYQKTIEQKLMNIKRKSTRSSKQAGDEL